MSCYPSDCRDDCHFRPFVQALAPRLAVRAVDPATSALWAAIPTEPEPEVGAAANGARPESPQLKLQLLMRASAQRQLRVWLVLPWAPTPVQRRWLDAACTAGQGRIEALRAALAPLRTTGTVHVPRSCRLRADKCIAWGCTWEIDATPRWPLDDALRFAQAALDFLNVALRSASPACDAACDTHLKTPLRLRTGRVAVGRALDPVSPVR